jgi:replicative DNA helicase
MPNTQLNNTKKPSITQQQAFAMNNNQIPSQVVDIEECVLGALIVDEDALINTIDKIRPEHFYKEENREIFNAIYSLNAEGNDVDRVTVIEKLRKRGMYEAVGGSFKIATLLDKVTSGAHIETYVKILAEKYIQRELIRVSTQTLSNAYKETSDILELLDETESSFLAINDSNFNSQEKSMSTLSELVIREIDEAQKSDSNTIGLPSGFYELDNITGGFQPGALIILAARPAMGKTAFALNIARNMAVQYGKSVAVFSLEMTATELMMRLVSSEAEVEGQRLKRGDQITTQELERVKQKARELGNCKMYIDDNPGLNIMELKAKCKRMKKAHGIDMVFIDYLQLMNGNDAKNNNREQEISYISRQLKSLAKELSIPVFALSQLSREVEKRGGTKEPMLSDLRESGAIEQDADIVMFIYRPEYYGQMQDNFGSTEGIAYINVAKNRSGSIRKARLRFKGQYVRFENIDIASSMPNGNVAFDNDTQSIIMESKANNDMGQIPTNIDNIMQPDDDSAF